MATNFLTTVALSHTQKVKALYKNSLRTLQSYYVHRHLYRYHAVVLRARFDENKNEADVRKAKQMLLAGHQEYLSKEHVLPLKFPTSPGGVAYDREGVTPDWLLDMWHPLERLNYPEYFAKREQRKKEFMQRWEKEHGNSERISEH